MKGIIIKDGHGTRAYSLEEAVGLIPQDDLDTVGYHMDTQTLDAAMEKLAGQQGAYTLAELLACYLEMAPADLLIDLT